MPLAPVSESLPVHEVRLACKGTRIVVTKAVQQRRKYLVFRKKWRLVCEVKEEGLRGIQERM